MLVYDVEKNELVVLLTKEGKGIRQEEILSLIKVNSGDVDYLKKIGMFMVAMYDM